jgi:hypothetical protein
VVPVANREPGAVEIIMIVVDFSEFPRVVGQFDDDRDRDDDDDWMGLLSSLRQLK